MIRAIPTVHRSIKMRSKLEASFAAALDQSGVEWVYEAEGFDIDGVWYLPDFWLPSFRAFVEVKGVIDDSVLKPRKLAKALTKRQDGRRVFLALPEHVQQWTANGRKELTHIADETEWKDRDAALARCPTCGRVDIHSSRCCLSIYMAGKILGSEDWRFPLVSGLSRAFRPDHAWCDLEIAKCIDSRHIYTGPFFRSEKRIVVDRYGEDANSHMAEWMGKAHDGCDQTREQVFEECENAIRRSDFVFARIDDVTAYGTLVEIGYAKAYGRHICVVGDAPDDLWFARQAADVHATSNFKTSPAAALRESIAVALLKLPLSGARKLQ